MKKKSLWYPIVSLKKRFVFGSYGKGIYIDPGVVINRPRYMHIGEGSWLGYNVIVLPNVTIGKHCIIGALSVVKTNIPPYSMAVGSPARIVKRFDFNRKEWVRYPGTGSERWAEDKPL